MVCKNTDDPPNGPEGALEMDKKSPLKGQWDLLQLLQLTAR